MNTGKLLVLASILAITTTLMVGTGCKIEQKKSQSEQTQYSPPPPSPTLPTYTNHISLKLHGVVVKMDDEEFGLIIFQGNPSPSQPGLIITCKEQLPVGTPVELFIGNHWILDGDRPGRGQNCLQIRISRLDTNSSVQPFPISPFRAQMFDEVVFRGMGTVIASEKGLGLVAVQDGGAERRDLPAIFIDAPPRLERNDPVTCTVKQVALTANGLPGNPKHFAFRITIERLPGKIKGEAIAFNPPPR